MNEQTVDAAGIGHTPAGDDARIVSLVPSITELLFALGLDRQIVGRTGFCVHPRERVRAVPKVGGTKSVRIDAVRALKPTHAIVNIDENERTTVDALRAFVPHIIVTHPLAPEHNLALFALLGTIFRREDAARRLGQALNEQLDAIGARDWPSQRVLYAIWRDPWMTVARDTYISAVLRLVNWQTLPAVDGGPAGARRYPAFELDAPWLDDVDRILLSTEPYRFTQSHCDALAQALQAAGKPTGKRIELIDGEQVSWYGSRAIEGIGYLQRYASGQ
ncbi:helical backbone metal receptor [Paraburkholderia sp. SARCC-3016]|uniref:helical backbone metal receptor n=1 Tax=Paraburkholderia sp. SARCC-3016 TaxID=3058611 RepID=UPI0028072BE3|nr:helical backbone metal receptor [Paraburkholderia sp. SARCC-3016]MDQ7980211.1 helical backbone metal receptor [Paraburkholderia sp. SARCC-3016]